MDARLDTLATADGARLAFRAWEAPRPRAQLLVSHGLGEHGGRYAELARALAERGISVHALDHRGHGRSPGARGHVDRFARLVSDFDAFRAAVTPAAPVPRFLLGHSLGGLVAIRHLQAHPEAAWAGVVLSAPLLGIAVRAPRWKTAISGVLSRVLPRLPFHNEIALDALSSEPGYEAAYRADPLLHQTITPRMYTEMGVAMREARAGGRLPQPLLVIAPGADTVADPAAVTAWAAEQGAEVRRYDGFRHEALNERGRGRVLADVVAWIEARLAACTARLAAGGGTPLAH